MFSVLADESPRSIVRNEAVPARPAANALPPFTAISAKGFIHSTERGFRFPDGTVQSTAATVTGGVPSVNDITGEVSIYGTGATTVQTSLGSIQIHTPVTPPVYTRTIIVSPHPSNDLQGGVLLINAVNAATGATPKSATLIKVEPGVYDIGSAQLVMKPYVDIEGSGEGVTLIETHRGGTVGDVTSAGIAGASNSELRDLTVRTSASSGTFTSSVGASSAYGFRLRDVTLEATGAATVRTLYVSGSNVEVDRASIIATVAATDSVAVFTGSSANLTITNSSLLADGQAVGQNARAVHVGSGQTTVRSSTLRARGATNRASGFHVNSDASSVTHSTIELEDAPIRYGVSTANSSAVASVYHSLVIVGNEWVDTNVHAGHRGPFNGPVRFYASFLDSHSSTDIDPLCINSFWTTGGLDTDCTKAP